MGSLIATEVTGSTPLDRADDPYKTGEKKRIEISCNCWLHQIAGCFLWDPRRKGNDSLATRENW